MPKLLESSLDLNEFEPQSQDYGHFRTDTIGKVMNVPYPFSIK